MIDVDNYFKGFKPSFNEEKFQELIKNPPTNFMTDKGNVNIRKELSKSFAVACKMLWNEFDRNNIYYGGEGGGKSHTCFQHTYVWWWYLKELGMINYDFGIHLIYGRVKDLMEAFDKYKNIPFVIYTLDESEELNRKNWNNKTVKEFMGKLRRERKNLRIVNLILPALEEILPSIALSRINWVFEIAVDLNDKLDVVRGRFNLFNVPIGSEYFSPMRNDYITQKEIKSYLNARFYDTDKKFENLPYKLLAFRGQTNKTFVFDKEEYKQWARDINTKRDEEDEKDGIDPATQKRLLSLHQICFYLYQNKEKSQAELTRLLAITKHDVAKYCTTQPPTIEGI